MNHPRLKLDGFTFEALSDPLALKQLDERFMTELQQEQPELARWLSTYRQGHDFSALPQDQLQTALVQCAQYLDGFLARFFSIQESVARLQTDSLKYDPVIYFKKQIVQKTVKRRAKQPPQQTFEQLSLQLQSAHPIDLKDELAFAVLAAELEQAKISAPYEELLDWCVLAQKTPEGQAWVKDWISFQQPRKLDFSALIPMRADPDCDWRQALATEDWRQRDGFDLTDPRNERKKITDEVHYCVYCHKNDGDYCRSGFLQKKKTPESGFKKNPSGELLTGCPLDEKISEMNLLKRDGYVIAPLAVIMIDNPMCPATGHRICNDCMKACIYQKQTPVDIPQIETRVLTDVLSLPWGVEVYDLLTKWNPLRQEQAVMQAYNGHKVMVMGMGPAGFTLAHYLTLAGYAVVGLDGLKIEAIDSKWLNEPVYDFQTLCSPLSQRNTTGFGGVAEYGITVRWDKNFLALIYLTLMRRKTFDVFGGVRFGGTITVEKAWELGFDHVAVAVGAGLPRELPIENALAPGMRQANDFLMALQLTGAAKDSSLANLQIRLPAVVIGGGLTGVDAATEVQAYYIKQIEKVAHRYQALVNEQGEIAVRARFDSQDLVVLDEYLAHAEEVKAERQRAALEKRQPDLVSLMRRFGGSTIVYRRAMQDSPAYRKNPEELHKALEEGIYYADHLTPKRVVLDERGHTKALVCETTDGQEQILPARCILVATGAKPNVAYSFEHRDTFLRENLEYVPFEMMQGQLQRSEMTSYDKLTPVGMLTSYEQQGRHVSFLGDTHPTYHGNVVKAIASAKACFTDIDALFTRKDVDSAESLSLLQTMRKQFSAKLIQRRRISASITELVVEAPLAASQYAPGQFYRLQNFEGQAERRQGTLLQSEGLAMLAAPVFEQPQQLSFWLINQGVSRKIAAQLPLGQALTLMGPTGVRTKIPDEKTAILIIGGVMALMQLRALAPAWQAAGHHVYYIGVFNQPEDVPPEASWHTGVDQVLYCFNPDLQQGIDKSKNNRYFGTLEGLLQASIQGDMVPLPWSEIGRAMVVGDTRLLCEIKRIRGQWLDAQCIQPIAWTASVYGPMQCMLKGVCAQCLQWQIDPKTGKRTKAVYACSWQDQPYEKVDIQHIDERLVQNRMQETLSELWYEHIFSSVEAASTCDMDQPASP
jgi:NADPH-dependent glutamate synthase beta subunit-like oxidoreductase/NAD(P)H-flavin reductase